MAFAYLKYKDGTRKSITIDQAHKLRSAMKHGADMSAQQKEFIKNIDHVFITSKSTDPHLKPTQPISRLTAWEQEREEV
jgi:hypothetical protein